MSSPALYRPNRGSGGGRALMLLGVLLAVLSGVLVIYIVSQATNNAGASIQLIVVKQTIGSGTTLHTADIQADFGVESYPANLVPAGAYQFVSEDALQVHLNLWVVLVEMVPGDILLTQDLRVGPPGTDGRSITSINQSALQKGDVLFAFQYASPGNANVSFISPGDTVDILVLECSAPYTSSGCVDATTLTEFAVYETFQVPVCSTHDEASRETSVLRDSGTVSMAIRNPATGSVTIPAYPPHTAASGTRLLFTDTNASTLEVPPTKTGEKG